MSSIKEIFMAVVTDDLDLSFSNRAKFKQHLLPLKGKLVQVTAELPRKHRTDAQSRYYRGVVLKVIGDHCGYRGSEELESLHQEMRRKFLPKRGSLNIPVSTTDLNTQEMTEYIETIRQWAASELGLYVPSPDEATTD